MFQPSDVLFIQCHVLLHGKFHFPQVDAPESYLRGERQEVRIS